MYKAAKRIERDGFLVAFEGETMTDEEARRRGLVGQGEAATDDGNIVSVGTTAVVNPPIDENWADAAGMDVDECKALWNENPSAVLDAIKANLAPENAEPATDDGAGDGAEDSADADGNAADSDDKEAKPSAKELRAECEARGIKAPKNATIAQLEALLEG